MSTGSTATSGTSPTLPAVPDVGALIRARTREKGSGRLLGTFSALTEPTDAEVLQIIEQAALDVAPKVGVAIPVAAQPHVRRLVAIRAAMLVELGYFAQQINSGDSPYPQLRDLYKDQVAVVLDAVQDAAGGGDPGGVDDRPGPLATFPAAPCDDVPGSECWW